MTIKKQVIDYMTAQGATYIGDASAYNIHGFRNANKNSNLHKFLADKDAGEYVAIVGAKGRSAHSATALHIFKMPDNDSYFYIGCGRDYFLTTKKG